MGDRVSQRGIEMGLWPCILPRWKGIHLNNCFLWEGSHVSFSDSLFDMKHRTLPPGLLILGGNTPSKTLFLYFLLCIFLSHVPANGLGFFTPEALHQSGYLVYQSWFMSSIFLKFGSIAFSKLIIAVISHEREYGGNHCSILEHGSTVCSHSCTFQGFVLQGLPIPKKN